MSPCATDGDQVSAYFRTNQMELLDNIRADDRKSREVVMLPVMHQIRTTRRIEGNYTLKYGDMYRHFPDSVAVEPLQKALAETGVVIHFDDAWIPKGE